MYKLAFYAGLGTANLFTQQVYQLNFEELPKAFDKNKTKERIEKMANSVKIKENEEEGTAQIEIGSFSADGYVDPTTPLTPPSSNQISPALKLLGTLAMGGLAIFGAVSSGIGIPLAIAGGLGVGLSAGLDTLFSYLTNSISNSIISFLRSFAVETIVPASILLTYYSLTIITVFRFLIYIPFFILSLTFLAFDKTKDTFVSNLTKYFALFFHPLAIAIGFYLSTEFFILFRDKMINWMNEVNLGFLPTIIICISSFSVIVGIFISIIKSATNFVDAIFNVSSVIMSTHR